MNRRWLPRIVAAFGTSAAAIVLMATPAQAHQLGPGVAALNYRTTVSAVTPDISGMSLRVVDDGLHVIARNDTVTPLVIDGYDGEPYLKVDAVGAWENIRSPAVYLNGSFTSGSVPTVADAAAEPDWRRIGSGGSVMWHDHRLHWMGTGPPPQVRRDPGRYNLISIWRITGRYGTRPFRATGELAWVPPPDPAGWLVLLLVIAVVTGMAGMRARLGLALTMAFLAGSDLLRSIGLVQGRAGVLSTRLVALPAKGLPELGLVLLLAVTALLVRRRETLSVYCAVFAGAAVLVTGVAVSLPILWRSQVIAWQPWWRERLLVTLTAGTAAGLLAAGLLRLRVISRGARVRAAAAVAAGALLITGCGASSDEAPDAQSSGGTVVGTRDVRGLGSVLANGRGHVLYMFVPDKQRSVTCTTICQGTWPPVTASSVADVVTEGRVNRRLFGLDHDPSGGADVVTYRGWPLYTYVGDLDPGVANGQALDLNGGYWYVLAPSGRVIRKAP